MNEAKEAIDWQAWAALAVVVATALLLAARAFRRSGKPAKGCGKCGDDRCD